MHSQIQQKRQYSEFSSSDFPAPGKTMLFSHGIQLISPNYDVKQFKNRRKPLQVEMRVQRNKIKQIKERERERERERVWTSLTKAQKSFF